jgi:hypothetical protein
VTGSRKVAAVLAIQMRLNMMLQAVTLQAVTLQAVTLDAIVECPNAVCHDAALQAGNTPVDR